MAILVNLVYILIALISAATLFIRYRYSYWKRLRIPHDPPKFPYGSFNLFQKKRHLKDLMKDYYDKFRESRPFVGFFFIISPLVMILDLDLAKDILIKDFHNFADRGMYHNERDDPLSGNLFGLDGAKWRSLRNKLSPTFTSGKMKFMFPTMVSVGDELVEVFSKICEKDSIIEMKDVLARFTTDVIGTCAFGIDCNSLKDPNAEFRVMGGKAFTLTRHGKIVEGFMMGFPNLARKLRLRLVHEDIHEFYMRVVRETVEYREKNNIKRNDFMNLLIELKNSEDGLTIEEIAAQSFLFFIAGFETSSTTMGFALYELALNQDIQDKLRTEIDEQYKKNGGKFTYDCMAEMHYMEKVIKETLRKYSINFLLMRKTLNDYPTKDPKYTIPKGVVVLIPSDAIHLDPEIYPDPETFDPERFSQEEIQKRHPMTWLAFGDGPRNCIGLRFGKMQMYIGLAVLLKNFRFHYCEKTPNPIVIDPIAPLPIAKGGVFLRVERI